MSACTCVCVCYACIVCVCVCECECDTSNLLYMHPPDVLTLVVVTGRFLVSDYWPLLTSVCVRAVTKLEIKLFEFSQSFDVSYTS